MSKKNSGDVSASVEESNALRKKLGLKPLDEGDDKKKKLGTTDNPVEGLTSSAPKADARSKKEAAASAKSKKDHDNLTKGEGLGDILAREEGKSGAADWVAKTRGKDGSMKTTGAAASAPAAGDKKKGGSSSANVPKGMKVRHDSSQIQEGEEVVMTLSDQQILNADGEIDESVQDELSNVRMADGEKAKHNDAVKNRKEYDAQMEGQDILEKYNDLKTGPKGFMIGGGTMGMIEEPDPTKRLAILTALSEKQSLETKNKYQSDFYTSEEMSKFRKPAKQKKGKKRKQDKLDKEDQMLGPATTVDTGRPADAGSDEEDPELYEQLSKQRRLVRRSDAGAVRKGEAALNAVSERIATLENNDDEEKEVKEKAKKDGDISMTATTEFCNVVQTPLEKMDTMKHESFRGSTLYKQQVAQRKGLKMSLQKNKGMSNQGHLDAEDHPAFDEADAHVETLTEDQLDLSCASGLAYLRARAQIGNDQDSHKNRKSDNRPLEMSKLDGDIKLEYRDDFGRVQTPKEAFRAISWKFHGKVPGRKNMERRILRLENEMKLKAMNPMEQLPTLRALRHVQVAEAKPFMVLSGANEK